MKFILSIIFSSIYAFSFSQKSIKTDIHKWIKAVVNVQTKNDLETKSSQKILHEYYEKYKAKQITFDKYIFIQDSLRYLLSAATGSTIFLKYKGKRYLITAKHVVLNTQSTLKDTAMYDFLFRVPLENEGQLYDDKYIGKLNQRLYNEGTYIFSNNEIDLAILSIDTKNPEFGDFLQKRGHIPISINDIDTICDVDYGQEVMCVGYPMYSFEGLNNLQNMQWAGIKSIYVVHVATTFGKISVPAYHNHFFITDITIMPGNSGGAIVRDDKLIGIVSSQPYYFIEDYKTHQQLPYVYRLPIANIIKTSEIMPLLHQLRVMLKDE